MNHDTPHYSMNIKSHACAGLTAGVGIALFAFIATGCGGSNSEAASPEAGAEIENTESESNVTRVGISRITAQSFSHRFSVQGNIETDRNALLTSEFGGVIEAVLVREGEQVQSGDPLVRVNTDVIDRSISELDNQLELARVVFERQDRLWKQNIGSELEYLQSKTQLEGLERSKRTLLEQKDMAVMRAPFAGVVDRCLAKAGEFAMPGAPLVRIVNLKDLYVRASVSDHYAGKIAKGMAAEVVVSGVDTISTTIGRVGQFINPSNRTLEITLPLPATTKFLPNMYASVWLQDVKLDSAVVLPNALVQQDINGDNFVFIARGTGAEREVEKRILELGMGSGDVMLIRSGLELGMDVISKGANRVVAGQRVNVIAD